jgi:hypothetical protein
MADRDRLDTNFLAFVVVAFILIFALAVAIFPQHEATVTASPGASPAGAPQK